MNDFLYKEIINFIKTQIAIGRVRENDILPSETQISQKFKVSRMTVRQAYDELEKEGLLYRVKGKGTFAGDGVIKQSLGRLRSFTEEVKLLGCKPGTKLNSSKIIQANKEMSLDLQIKEKEEALEVVRLRYIDNKIFSINTSYFPVKRYPEIKKLDFSSMSIYELIVNETGFKVKWADQLLSAISATKNMAELLDIKEGSPLLYMKRIAYIVNDIPIELTKAVFRPDRYSFQIKLRR